MAFTMVAHGETIDPAGVFANLAALVDDHIFRTGDFFRVPSLNRLIAICAGVASGGSGYFRVESPSLRKFNLVRQAPFNGENDGDVEPGSPLAIIDMRNAPVTLPQDEQVSVLVDSNPTSAAFQWVLYLFSDGEISPVAGDIRTIRATSSQTLTVDAWTQGELTLDEELPVGEYQLVGMRAQSAGLVAARCVFRPGTWRPGVPGTDAPNDLSHEMFRMGQLGTWGKFHSLQLPAVEFLSVSADTSEIVFFDVIPMAGVGA